MKKFYFRYEEQIKVTLFTLILIAILLAMYGHARYTDRLIDNYANRLAD